MISRSAFNIILTIFLYFPIFVVIMLTIGKVTVPYGKLISSRWGTWSIPDRWGWIIMESPSCIILTIFLLTSPTLSLGQIVLFFIWQFHYFYRCFIYPFISIHSKRMPISLMFSALSFQLINTYLQGIWIYHFAPAHMYDKHYLTSWYFIIGLIIFLLGTYINRTSDKILKNLRKPGEKEYKIPYGHLYKYVSCPNYLGEILIWLGWAILSHSLVGFAFFIWTIANLAPRAISSHQWYLAKFSNYPKERKALIPYIL